MPSSRHLIAGPPIVNDRQGPSVIGRPRGIEGANSVQPGRIQIRPLGGWPGCLLMILFSVVASVVGTVLLNLLLR
jgi:hypothetical protein